MMNASEARSAINRALRYIDLVTPKATIQSVSLDSRGTTVVIREWEYFVELLVTTAEISSSVSSGGYLHITADLESYSIEWLDEVDECNQEQLEFKHMWDRADKEKRMSRIYKGTPFTEKG